MTGGVRSLGAIGWLLLFFGLAMLGNAGWMLLDPGHWYTDLPAAVPDTGPYNAHFVRDIGCAFLTVGVALTWGAFSPRTRAPLTAVAALFLMAHALLHVYDTASGLLPSSHWELDFAGVYLPAIVVSAVAWILWRREHA
ncbi:MAG: hypothetical protein VCB78_08940 [Myxococcota bacterium]